VPKDCRNVEDLIADSFKAEDSPTALILYVGDKPTSVPDCAAEKGIGVLTAA
jgi:hypothetical protein